MNEAVIRQHLERAADLARKNSTIRSFQTGAVLAKRQGPRSISPYSWGEGWSHSSTLRLVKFRSIHAELHAIMRSWRQSGCYVFVATVRGKSGNIGLARPCDACAAILHDAGVIGAFYTVEGPDYGFLDFGHPF